MSGSGNPKELLTAARRDALARLGFSGVPELVEALLPALARGHHVALLAAEGSGKEALYALAAGARCQVASPEVQALVLAPTDEAARRAARAAHLLNREEALEALAWPLFSAGESEPAERPVAHLLAGRPPALLGEVRAGRLSLAELRLVVVDGLEALRETGAWEATEALLDTLGGEGQKILCALRRDAELERLLESRLPRARRWPPELLGPGGAEGEGGAGTRRGPTLRYGAGAGEEERLELLARGLRVLAAETGEDRAFVRCPDADTAHRAAAALAAAGLDLADERGEPGVAVAWGEDEEPPGGSVAALLGLPTGLPELRRWLGDATARLAVVATPHVTQLGLLARRAGWTARELPAAPPGRERDAIARFRERLREELEAEDVGAELLLLEPLLEAHGAVRVASALARLLRRRAAEPADGAEPGVAEPSVRPAWTRIFVNVGKKDGAGPGDLVGAITGETAATGAQIGKVEVRPTFSLVEVDSQIADDVIRSLRGKTIRNREVVARRDRTS